MERGKARPSPDMAVHLKRLRLVREVALSVEWRTQVQRDASTSKPSDVAKGLAANHAVRVAAHRMLDGDSRE
ncbi:MULTISPECIES: hypothetical protein [Paraburkholderia]|uniref:hypothetical protein n=1 Tax=Paraburkholderia TaxID=1822464 RepID=UPI0013A6A8CF|nr:MULTISPECIES: hypothetical protein [Paraburkholderia]MDH6150509.1 hypothetical protein [Paraburkholderia sp. WSM4179]